MHGGGGLGPIQQISHQSPPTVFTTRLETYTRESNTAVTALGCRSALFEMVVDEFGTRGLHHAPAVRFGVVRIALAEGDTLGHY